LFVAAPASRAGRPSGHWAVTFIAGCAAEIGVARFDTLLDWWATLDPLLARTWSACAAAVGALIAYGIIPRDAR
jgi:hypothetical protein